MERVCWSSAISVIFGVWQVMMRGRVVAHMLPSLSYASKEGLTQPLTLISRLVLASPTFAQQYLQAQGLEAPTLNR